MVYRSDNVLPHPDSMTFQFTTFPQVIGDGVLCYIISSSIFFCLICLLTENPMLIFEHFRNYLFQTSLEPTVWMVSLQFSLQGINTHKWEFSFCHKKMVIPYFWDFKLYDFSMTTFIFQDFPGPENSDSQFYNFPGRMATLGLPICRRLSIPVIIVADIEQLPVRWLRPVHYH